MKKGIIIFMVLVLLIIAGAYGGYVYLEKTSKPQIRTELSNRSKEFLAGQMNKSDSDLRTVDLESKRAGESDFDSNRIIVKSCYSLIVPFAVSDDRQNDPCVYYAILESPRGSMTTSLRDVGFSKVDEAPDVNFRRNKKDQYKEESFVVGGQKYLVFTDTQTNVEKTAFSMARTGEQNQMFTVSLNTGGDDELKMRQLQKIVASFMLE